MMVKCSIGAVMLYRYPYHVMMPFIADDRGKAAEQVKPGMVVLLIGLLELKWEALLLLVVYIHTVAEQCRRRQDDLIRYMACLISLTLEDSESVALCSLEEGGGIEHPVNHPVAPVGASGCHLVQHSPPAAGSGVLLPRHRKPPQIGGWCTCDVPDFSKLLPQPLP